MRVHTSNGSAYLQPSWERWTSQDMPSAYMNLSCARHVGNGQQKEMAELTITCSRALGPFRPYPGLLQNESSSLTIRMWKYFIPKMHTEGSHTE